MNTMDTISNFIKKYMSIMVIIAAVTGFFKPIIFIWAVPHLNTFLGFIMFGMGMTLKEEDFLLIIKRPKDVILGTIIQFVIMPFSAYIIAKIFNLSGELAVGLILLGSCPGGVTSNVMSFIAKGDVALSVTFTTVSTLLAPIITPAFILIFAGKLVDIDGLGMFLSISKVVLIPIVLGGVCHKYFKKFSEQSVRVLPAISGMTMVLIVGAIVSANGDKLLVSGVVITAAVMIHNTIGYFLGYFAGGKIGFNEEQKRVLSIETGMKNATLATTLAMTHFSPIVAIAPAIAGIWHAFSVSALANYWSNRSVEEIKIIEDVKA